jgi:hypothetical protein
MTSLVTLSIRRSSALSLNLEISEGELVAPCGGGSGTGPPSSGLARRRDLSIVAWLLER